MNGENGLETSFGAAKFTGMIHTTLEVPEEAVERFGPDEWRFGRRMFETAVVNWFDEAEISQGKAAELLGISRGELFDLLWQHKVSPIQITPEELAEELKGVIGNYPADSSNTTERR